MSRGGKKHKNKIKKTNQIAAMLKSNNSQHQQIRNKAGRQMKTTKNAIIPAAGAPVKTVRQARTPRKSVRLALKRLSGAQPAVPSVRFQNRPAKHKQTTTTYAPRASTNTIVIEDSDEENEPNGTSDVQQPNPAAACGFYEDRSPGVRECEIPLYKTEATVVEAADAAVPDVSVIVLDCTLENTLHITESNIEDAPTPPPPPPLQPSLERGNDNNNLRPIESIDVESPTTTTTTSTTTTSIQCQNVVVSDVIDLSDDSEDDCLPAAPPCAPINRIPLGYNFADTKRKPPPARSPKKSPPQRARSPKKKTSLTSKSREIPPTQVPTSGPTATSTADEGLKKRMVVIDGNNVAYGHLNGKMFSVKGLDLCINYFKKLGHEVVAVVPQYKLKRSQSTDQGLLEQLHRQGDVILAPCKSIPGQYSSSYDDRLILSVAEKFDGVIVSNDNFRDLLDSSPTWSRIIKTRVIGYTWMKDCFFLPDDPYGRLGPSLQAILNGYSV